MAKWKKDTRVIIREIWQAEFLALCEQKKYENIVPLEDNCQVFTYAIWCTDIGNLWCIMYFVADTGKSHQDRRMYFSEDEVQEVVTRLRGERQLKRLSYRNFMHELVQRAKQESLQESSHV